MVKQLEPTFDLKEFNFATFSVMLKSLGRTLVGFRKCKFDEQIRTRRPDAEEST